MLSMRSCKAEHGSHGLVHVPRYAKVLWSVWLYGVSEIMTRNPFFSHRAVPAQASLQQINEHIYQLIIGYKWEKLPRQQDQFNNKAI